MMYELQTDHVSLFTLSKFDVVPEFIKFMLYSVPSAKVKTTINPTVGRGLRVNVLACAEGICPIRSELGGHSHQ